MRRNLALFQAGTRDSSLLLSVHTGPGFHPTLYLIFIRDYFHGSERPRNESDHFRVKEWLDLYLHYSLSSYIVHEDHCTDLHLKWLLPRNFKTKLDRVRGYGFPNAWNTPWTSRPHWVYQLGRLFYSIYLARYLVCGVYSGLHASVLFHFWHP